MIINNNQKNLFQKFSVKSWLELTLFACIIYFFIIILVFLSKLLIILATSNKYKRYYKYKQIKTKIKLTLSLLLINYILVDLPLIFTSNMLLGLWTILLSLTTIQAYLCSTCLLLFILLNQTIKTI
jgi:hypothetical protein